LCKRVHPVGLADREYREGWAPCPTALLHMCCFLLAHVWGTRHAWAEGCAHCNRHLAPTWGPGTQLDLLPESAEAKRLREAPGTTSVIQPPLPVAAAVDRCRATRTCCYFTSHCQLALPPAAARSGGVGLPRWAPSLPPAAAAMSMGYWPPRLVESGGFSDRKRSCEEPGYSGTLVGNQCVVNTTISRRVTAANCASTDNRPPLTARAGHDGGGEPRGGGGAGEGGQGARRAERAREDPDRPRQPAHLPLQVRPPALAAAAYWRASLGSQGLRVMLCAAAACGRWWRWLHVAGSCECM
jgi:hypothetical protein